MSISAMLRQMESSAVRERGTGATDREIADAETAIGDRLPTSYKVFLSTFGWARIYYDPIFGVGPSVPLEYGLVRHTMGERYEFEPNIPHHLIPVMNDGAGNHYCLDTANFHGEECPVVFWDHEHEDGSDQAPGPVSPSFDRWIVDLIIESPCAGDA